VSGGETALLTLLSALELVVLLAALAFALYRIQGALDRINITASKILWGVRAIEHETDPLRDGLPHLRDTLSQVVAGAGAIADGLASADHHLGQAAEALSGPRR
jgi:uncharacterized protein YoxC